MRTYSEADIRDVALIGHGGAGKTSLGEAILFDTKAVTREVDRKAATQLVEQAEQAYAGGKSSEAERLYHRALEQDRNNVAAIVGLYDLHFDRAEFRDALGYAKRALALQPKDKQSWTALGMAHHGWSSFDQDRPLYIEGRVLKSRWQNPHAELEVEMTAGLRLPSDLAQRPLPAQTAPVDGKGLLAKTALPTRKDRRWEVELAPLTRLEAWKVAEIKAGATVAVVAE